MNDQKRGKSPEEDSIPPELSPIGEDAETDKGDPSVKVEVESEAPHHKAAEELLYLKAEFENYRKRIAREQESSVKYANEKIIKGLIDIVDLFDKALIASDSLVKKADKEIQTFIEGVQMTHRELVHLLTRFGVEFVGTAGEQFDPNRHEAISQEETPADKAGTVVTVFQRGCLLNGRLLKPARVSVGTAKK